MYTVTALFNLLTVLLLRLTWLQEGGARTHLKPLLTILQIRSQNCLCIYSVSEEKRPQATSSLYPTVIHVIKKLSKAGHLSLGINLCLSSRNVAVSLSWGCWGLLQARTCLTVNKPTTQLTQLRASHAFWPSGTVCSSFCQDNSAFPTNASLKRAWLFFSRA